MVQLEEVILQFSANDFLIYFVRVQNKDPREDHL